MGNYTKTALRKEYLNKRKLMTRSELDALSAGLLKSFKQHFSTDDYHRIHVFLPIEKQSEINTRLFIDFLQAEGRQIIVSRSELNSSRMLHFIYEDEQQLELNKWGILEPAYGEEVQEAYIDLVLVPLLVFDRLGSRVGYGRGYYDRFLSKCRPDCKKIGLSLFPPVDFISNMEVSDIKMDYCISPLGLHTFA